MQKAKFLIEYPSATKLKLIQQTLKIKQQNFLGIHLPMASTKIENQTKLKEMRNKTNSYWAQHSTQKKRGIDPVKFVLIS